MAKKLKTIFVPYCISERGNSKIRVNRGPWWGLAADTAKDAMRLAAENCKGLGFVPIKATYEIPAQDQ